MYYVMIGETVSGPHGVEEVGHMLAEGTILPITLAVEEGHENWMPLERLMDIRVERSVRTGHIEDAGHPMHLPKGAKKCPFCGAKKIRSASKEFNGAGAIRIFQPKVCRHCEAIWSPRVEVSSALQVFLVGIIFLAGTLAVVLPELAHVVGARESGIFQPGVPAIIGWVVCVLLIIGSAIAVSKSLRYLKSGKAREFKVLRHPHRQALH
ncbi:GYF domain-containing protein [Luteolibacter sp. Populi]|uniref:GYF domain-containing protein n=1 Tax=Luteolibacter sp. Populi TaxID=3230487 RepID=UPI003465945E